MVYSVVYIHGFLPHNHATSLPEWYAWAVVCGDLYKQHTHSCPRNRLTTWSEPLPYWYLEYHVLYKFSMASLAQKVPSCLALVSMCCLLFMFILVFRQQPWQKVLIKHINIEQSVQILESHQEQSNQSPGKSTSREATVKRELRYKGCT